MADTAVSAIIVSSPHYFRQATKGGKRVYCDLARVCILFLLVVGAVGSFASPTFKAEATWLKIGDISLTVGYEVNQLNALMLVIVSLVSFLVHTYSVGYMKGDDRL